MATHNLTKLQRRQLSTAMPYNRVIRGEARKIQLMIALPCSWACGANRLSKPSVRSSHDAGQSM
jgi:hypothetical protein